MHQQESSQSKPLPIKMGSGTEQSSMKDATKFFTTSYQLMSTLIQLEPIS